MSIQSDVEILSIQAVEHYANFIIFLKDAVNLFHKHQVFEKNHITTRVMAPT